MTILLILAHRPLASALREVAGHCYADAAQRVLAYDVPPGDDFDVYLREAEQLLAPLADQDVLILTDAIGGSPANLAAALVRGRPGRKALSGVNVPMVWRALNYAHLPLDELWTRARDGAVASIQSPATVPPQHQTEPPAPDHASDQSHHQQ